MDTDFRECGRCGTARYPDELDQLDDSRLVCADMDECERLVHAYASESPDHDLTDTSYASDTGGGDNDIERHLNGRHGWRLVELMTMSWDEKERLHAAEHAPVGRRTGLPDAPEPPEPPEPPSWLSADAAYGWEGGWQAGWDAAVAAMQEFSRP